jgi:RHS repeat-associated protein
MQRGGFFWADYQQSSAAYDYQSGTSFNTTVARTTGAQDAPMVTTTKTPDGIGRLKSIQTSAGEAVRYAMTYGYQNGLRTTASTTLGDWTYAYNARGELTGGVKKKAGVVVPGYEFGYGFDAIGNRTRATMKTHGHTSTSLLTPNSLNQLDGRTVPGTLHIRGHVEGNATGVQVRSTGSPFIDGRPIIAGDFAATVPVDNSAWVAATTVDIRTTTSNPETEVTDTRRVVLPPANETITHDADGNMTSDGLWIYEWDGENRLIRITARPEATPWLGSPARFDFAYDWMNRRIHSTVRDSAGTLLRRTKFLWDGWNIIGQTDMAATPDYTIPSWNWSWASVSRTYVWGNDVSGSPEGAGGVGGLLAVHASETTNYVSTGKTYFPSYDGNGNIMNYLNATTGEIEQEEEYGPFGENLRPRSTNILRCPIGWSTKYTDEETGLVAYQLRYYNPTMGRWLSRDPIGERGGRNLYEFVGNHTISSLDRLGTTEFRVVTFIPQKEIEDPLGAIFAGDGSPNDFSPDRKSYRTLHNVRVNHVFTRRDNLSRDDILKQTIDTGVTIRYRRRSILEELIGRVDQRTL